MCSKEDPGSGAGASMGSFWKEDEMVMMIRDSTMARVNWVAKPIDRNALAAV